VPSHLDTLNAAGVGCVVWWMVDDVAHGASSSLAVLLSISTIGSTMYRMS
jgi:hypothetical protein